MVKVRIQIKNPSYGVAVSGPIRKLVVEGESPHPCGGLFAFKFTKDKKQPI